MTQTRPIADAAALAADVLAGKVRGRIVLALPDSGVEKAGKLPI